MRYRLKPSCGCTWDIRSQTEQSDVPLSLPTMVTTTDYATQGEEAGSQQILTFAGEKAPVKYMLRMSWFERPSQIKALPFDTRIPSLIKLLICTTRLDT